ncbi:gamma-glutamyl-gamma-aminobutyrate hydrolase family protein [Jatrophihabitans telluris]|uniref:Gamma-glutamyl-gamma-aminobutyrate hydrolase family protein n=1 Tax=Jatrophihabitans telluris TaxID=2038343 RepID=A0ABY4QUI6_9ACTN|nr:type 1 glutamine amidotransferase [Jatrophihabitans telluris]UQX87289.1 gamma-glutamyl-gamma-aminobutyrate hydrolase family protein [Jatrophihabitans telluris]
MSAAPLAAPILVIQNDESDPVGRLGTWLTDAGAELDVRSGPAGAEFPDDLSEHSALVVLGGAANAYDDDGAPWLPQVRRLLTGAVASDKPVLGVCLGGQLLAVAAGGRVERAASAEYGAQLVAKRQAAAGDPLFKELPITPDVLQWHVDEISRLPNGAVLLASSPGSEVQAFRVGRLAWGLQFHIETTPEMVATWAEEDAEVMADYDVARILERSATAHPDIEEAWRPVAAAFVDVARDPQAAAGPRTLPMAGPPASTAAPITDPAEIRAALAAELNASRQPHGAH